MFVLELLVSETFMVDRVYIETQEKLRNINLHTITIDNIEKLCFQNVNSS